jgi:hypothetical protein
MASKYVGIHADFTYARTQGKGAVAFAGDEVNRYFYGGHIELRYPVTANLSPFIFGGAGAATIQQSGTVVSFNRFTQLAGMFGAGLAYRVPDSPIDLLVEGKALTFKWDAAGFNRNQLDVTYSVGFAYRFGL